ncbi:MAG TPA: sigma-54 dependent transcriptional regulator [Terriglobia bacterium]|nr:sigma-54 dependent transcriptional regulator [Terriglobia bacterium]
MSPTVVGNSLGPDEATNLPPAFVIFGGSEAMQVLRRAVEKVADASVPVLIYGESGSGKEVLAKFIHSRSPRQIERFVKVNCWAIPGTLLESELFGYEKGSFTGAHSSKLGRMEFANRGTLFLDEISQIDLSLQAKLLELLGDGEFCRIGGQEERQVDVRVICATNRELEDQIEAGTFRRDLFYHINVVALRVPPLRERSMDLSGLVNYLLACWNRRLNGRAEPLSSQLMRSFEMYDWPGNIEELESLIKRYVILGSEESIAGEVQGRGLRRAAPSAQPVAAAVGDLNAKVRALKDEAEIEAITGTLERTKWNRKEAAKLLNISYKALLYKIRQYNIDRV